MKDADLLQKKIDDSRERIDEIDAQLVALIGERLTVTDEIGVCKKLLGFPSVDKERERQLRARVAMIAGTFGVNVEMVVNIFNLIMTEAVARREAQGSTKE